MRLVRENMPEAGKLASLLDISTILNSNLDINQLLPLVMMFARDLLNAEASSMLLVSEERDYLYCEVALGDKGETIQKYLRLEMGEGIAGWVAVEGKPVMTDDAYSDPRFNPEIDKKTGFKTESLICLPLVLEDRVIGTLQVLNKQGVASFDQKDYQLLTTLADVAAVAIQNAKLHENLQKRILELSLLYEFEKEISSEKSINQLGDWLLEKTLELMQARIGTIYLHDKESETLNILSARGLTPEQARSIQVRVGEGLAGWVASTRKPLLVQNLDKDPRYDSSAKYKFKTQSLITAPILYNDELLGVVSINDKESGFAFTPADLDVLQAIAGRLAITLQNRRLFIELNRQSEEQQRAARVMQGIIPTALPSFKGLEFGSYYRPYDEIGGDFYQFFKLSENRTGVLIADVTGHGLSAALLSAVVNTIVSTLPEGYRHSPGEFFYQLNNTICDRMRDNFITAFYAVFDTEKSTIRYANAGHIAPVIHRADTSIEYARAAGTLLGYKNGLKYTEKEITFSEGDIMLMITDGLLEIETGGRRFNISDDEITRISREVINVETFKMPTRLVGRVHERYPDSIMDDDVTVLAVKSLSADN